MHSTKKSQSGVALVAVLLFLILITIAGAIAVRQSRSDLQVATFEQARIITLNSSDSILAHVEQAGSDRRHPQYAKITSLNGMLGYFLVDGDLKIGRQITFCYRPDDANLFAVNNAFVRLPLSSGGGTQGSKTALCNPSNVNDYTSGRNIAMTQVVIQGLEDSLSDDFESKEFGTLADIGTQLQSPKLQINSITVLPALSKNASAIATCLDKPVGDPALYGATQNVRSCLKEKSIPLSNLVEDVLMRYGESGGFANGAIVDICTNDPVCRANAGLS